MSASNVSSVRVIERLFSPSASGICNQKWESYSHMKSSLVLLFINEDGGGSVYWLVNAPLHTDAGKRGPVHLPSPFTLKDLFNRAKVFAKTVSEAFQALAAIEHKSASKLWRWCVKSFNGPLGMPPHHVWILIETLPIRSKFNDTILKVAIQFRFTVKPKKPPQMFNYTNRWLLSADCYHCIMFQWEYFAMLACFLRKGKGIKL